MYQFCNKLFANRILRIIISVLLVAVFFVVPTVYSFENVSVSDMAVINRAVSAYYHKIIEGDFSAELVNDVTSAFRDIVFCEVVESC